MSDQFLSNIELRRLLAKATPEERLRLMHILEPKWGNRVTPEDLQSVICNSGGHSAMNLLRGQGAGYLDIVDDVAKKLDIRPHIPYYSDDIELPVSKFDEVDCLRTTREQGAKLGVEYAEKMEEKIILKLLELAYENMSPSERKEFDKQINDVAEQFDSQHIGKLAGASGLIILGNLGGFATYTFLTTSMSAISFGTLGFGAYTTATTTLSYLLGPPGWAALGAYGVFALGKPNMKKMVPVVAGVGAVRQRLKYEAQES